MDSNSFLNKSTMNQGLLNCENSVVGIVSQTAIKIKKDLSEGKVTYPFKEITPAHLGNPHVVGHKGVKFYRQVLSVCLNPDLLETTVYPEGVLKRAKWYLDRIPGGLGAYGPSQGHICIRENIAKYLEERDGVPSHPDHIQMADGTAALVADVISAHVVDKNSGILLPSPGYALYSGNVKYFNATPVYYSLNEEADWSIDVKELKKVYDDATSKGITIKLMFVCNPGNPAGNLLSKENQIEIIKFAFDHKISLFADEVYQHCSWGDSWIPFRRLVGKAESPYNTLPTYSIQSASKGWYGECGLRGGYVEFLNVDPDVESGIKKIETLPLSPNSVGQIICDLVARPPSVDFEGKEVVEQFEKEKTETLSIMRKNCEVARESFNNMKNMNCKACVGAMFAFPNVKFSDKAISAAKEAGLEADVFYLLEGLKETGMVLVSGSGFGQKEGSYHFRSTTLVRPTEKFEEILKSWKKFNDGFHEKYA